MKALNRLQEMVIRRKSVTKRQKIKHKLFVILFAVVFVVSLLSLIALQIGFYFYDKQLYGESAKVLNLVAGSIESELQKIEKISFLIMTDHNIQRHLRTINNSTGNYRVYELSGIIGNILNTYAWSEEYIVSIMLVDGKNNLYRAGAEYDHVPAARMQDISAAAVEFNGRNVWINPGAGDRLLVSARVVRQMHNLSLEHLGLVIVRIDLKKLIREISVANPTLNLLIFSDGQNIYTMDSRLAAEGDFGFTDNSGYQIKTIGGQHSFIAYTKSARTGWTYVNVIPYADIYEKITFLRYLMLFVYGLVFAGTIWVGYNFASNITKPIENLAACMNRVEQGDFTIAPTDSGVNGNIEEIHNLYHDFEIMVRRIETLIHENYAKQLLIKDTKYKALQAQINPHFLYNTLDSVNWLAKAGGHKEISVMVKALGDLLRSSISKEDVIVLDDELQILRDYITIQKIRYEERLDFRIDIADELLHYTIPKLTLQPIVENAMNHALEKMTGVCEIRVSARREENRLVIAVSDNGPGIDLESLERRRREGAKRKSSGIGLHNIEERIQMYFGREYGLRIESDPGRGTLVVVTIPAVTNGGGKPGV